MKQENIRNFSIIAHIDHGKSTLADRILELTGAITEREKQDQLLDNMDIERERGITIKLNAARLNYHYKGEDYTMHLIDTPGHVDFSYEVSRSLAACEGAVLVVDAAQGIEAQTLANVYLALENDLTIIPVINKIDLPNADIPKVKKELVETLGFEEEEIILTSAKTGEGVKDLIEAIIEKIPAPKGNPNDKLQALVFDSYFDPYKGVVVLVRIKNGKMKLKDKIKFMATSAIHEITELGYNDPKPRNTDTLKCGEVGYICASIKSISDIKVGDTITLENNPATESLPGYKPMRPMVFCGLYPVDTNKYPDLREALEKLKLNDAALEFEPETSEALGFGFRCGFLGLLHMEITLERLEREFGINHIATSPSVIYKITKTDNEIIYIDSPAKMPDRQKIKVIEEPYIKTNIYVPSNYIGSVMELCQNKRGTYISMEYITTSRVNIVDALSVIVHKDFAYNRGKTIVYKLKDIIPRQLFEVPIQAVIGSKVIARTDIKAMRKNVLAKCYGGDITRKRKLLEKQKEGKKRMKMVGKVEVPSEAFLAVLNVDEQ